MKKIAYILLAVTLTSCATYNRIGYLTIGSTRNIETKTEYQLLKKDVEGKARLKNSNALQEAIEQAVKQMPNGEFMKNIAVYKKKSKFIKVVGDVWGVQDVSKNISVSVNQKIELNVNDKVTFKSKKGGLVTAKIIGINQTHAILEYSNFYGKMIKKEVLLGDLTKLSSN